jgi:effector-binding domain-containing protein
MMKRIIFSDWSPARRSNEKGAMRSESVPEHEVTLEWVEPRPTLVVPAQVELDELAHSIPRLLDLVYRLIRHRQVENVGFNVVLYKGGADIEAGVLVSEPVNGEGQVISSTLPGGSVATTRYTGPYEGLGVAHDVIRHWCDAQGLALAGPSWEVYGHWDDDPAKRHTQVSYLLDNVEG